MELDPQPKIDPQAPEPVFSSDAPLEPVAIPSPGPEAPYVYLGIGEYRLSGAAVTLGQSLGSVLGMVGTQ